MILSHTYSVAAAGSFPTGLPGKASCRQRRSFGTDWTLRGAPGAQAQSRPESFCNSNSKLPASVIRTYTCSNSVAGRGRFQPDTAVCCWDSGSRSGGGSWGAGLTSQPWSGSVQPVAIFQPAGCTRKRPRPLGQAGMLEEAAARVQSNSKLRALAMALSPGFLRFGGTETDFLIFDPNKDSTSEEKILWELQAQQEACGSKPAFAAVEKLLLAQWPSQEKLILAEQNRKKHKNTTITRNTLDILYSFANCSGFHLIFGLNALLRKGGLQWDSSNAQELLDYCASQRYNISWELGNEPNSFRKKSGIHIDGFQLGQDFIHLRQLLNNYALYQHAKLYGPDVGQPRKHTQRLLRSFLKSGGKVIDSVTWHHYYVNGRSATRGDFLSPEVLDSFAAAIYEVLEIVGGTVPDKKVWLGETSSAYGGGAPRLSNTYVAGFMWLDKLGLSARQGIDVVMRQVFFGAGTYHLVDANFEPLPDYWLSLLYKKLVGTKVLQVGLAGADKRKLRVYLHCTNSLNPKYREGDVTLFALNLYNVTQHLELPNYLSSKHVDQYLLLPHGKENILSRSIELNGHVLRMLDDETLPELMEKPLGPGTLLGLPAFSYGFYVIKNAKAIACI
ncbi:PREDICTED: heparanase [Corvus brachyrhynchos]|uniref:heparanase n=1 Tax=Corvus brachyrhynchos TaxID=85066 RepID=UPI00081679AD|nr:PREDICTED: heparanase [Corvus brachyrhynchos]